MRLDDRGVTEVVGYLLILTLTVVSMGVLYLSGGPMMDTLQDSVYFASKETEFAALHDDLARTSKGLSPSQATKLGLGGGTLVTGHDPGVVNVTVYVNGNPDSYSEYIEYSRGDRALVYAIGGVWARHPGGGTTTIVEPDIHRYGSNCSISLVRINTTTDSVSGRGRATIVSNPIEATVNTYENASVSIKVGGEYAPAIARFLENEGFTNDDPYYNATDVDLTYSIREIRVSLD